MKLSCDVAADDILDAYPCRLYLPGLQYKGSVRVLEIVGEGKGD